MSLRNSTPLKWSPRGASDTLDASNTFTGAMAQLANLIRDPTTLGLWVCRPASALATSFAGFTTPGFISGYTVVGNQVYGLIASGRNAGKDEPFCYDLSTGLFVTVSGITGANSPTSPASSGAWTPPTFAVVGVYVIVTHPGFPGGAGNYFGRFDITNPAAPVWSAGNTAPQALTIAPKAVFQFGNRAYYAAGPYLVYSDVLLPLTVTNAAQALTLGDTSTSITALGGLPANNLVAGGIVQALIAFKGDSNPMQMWQIIGDAALGTLQVDNMPVATGTRAPSTICGTPRGLAFMAPDGLRFVDGTMKISDPVNINGEGVAAPFIYAIEPSRMAAACNGNTLRISTQNGYATGSPQQEWWFDFKQAQWSGPHSFPASCIKPYRDKFVLAATGVNAKLFTSAVQQETGSVYVENGTQMSWSYQTPMLPNTEQMAQNNMVETTVDIAFPSDSLPFTAVVGDQDGVLFDTIFISLTGTPTIWGAFNWGQTLWLGSFNALAPRQLAWHIPIVFQRLYLGMTGNSSASFRIGTARMRYEKLGYLNQSLPAA